MKTPKLILSVLFIALITLAVTVNVNSKTENQDSEASDREKHWQSFGVDMSKIAQHIYELSEGWRSDEQYGEIDQNLLWGLLHGALYLSQMDPDSPDWLPFANSSILYTAPNPDAVYYLSRIRGSGVYQITGNRGTVKLLDLQVNNGFIGFNDHAPTVNNVNFEDIEIAKDGTFEIVLSATRPENYKGNWLQIDASVDDTFLLVRQISYDWLNEVDAQFAIQRIDKPVNQTVRSAEDMRQRISQMPAFVERIAAMIIRIMEIQNMGEREPNRLEDVTKLFDNQPTNKNQSYYSGDVILKDDEALILEVEIPEQCPYWSIQLMDGFYNTLDYMFHQTNLNGHMVKVDPDGKARLVVSKQDPGVANWLDASGYEMTGIMGRWYKCGSRVPTTRLVNIAEVRKFLHPETPAVTPEQRQETLRNRIRAVQRRRRW